MGRKAPQLTLNDLKTQLADIGDRFPSLRDDGLFVLWFLRAYVTESEESAAEALTGGPGDQSVDAIQVDDAARMVFIVQGKYRQTLYAKSEPRADVLTFARLASVVADPDPAEFEKF